MTGHTDGKIAVWNVKNQEQPQTKFNPHHSVKETEADLVRSGTKENGFDIKMSRLWREPYGFHIVFILSF